MSAISVFTSFDVDHDRDLHDRLLEQSRGRSTFSITSRSERGAIDEAWSARARERIANASVLVVICGEHTDESSCVSAEYEIARAARKPVLLLWGRHERSCRKPRGAKADVGMYRWTVENVEYQLLALLRRRLQSEVPESMKRRGATSGG